MHRISSFFSFSFSDCAGAPAGRGPTAAKSSLWPRGPAGLSDQPGSGGSLQLPPGRDNLKLAVPNDSEARPGTALNPGANFASESQAAAAATETQLGKY